MADRTVELVDLNLMNDYIGEMQEVLQASALTERRAFIRSFIQEIKVSGNEAVLTYLPTIAPEMVELDGGKVPRISAEAITSIAKAIYSGLHFVTSKK